jgi:hypothetical protein
MVTRRHGTTTIIATNLLEATMNSQKVKGRRGMKIRLNNQSKIAISKRENNLFSSIIIIIAMV